MQCSIIQTMIPSSCCNWVTLIFSGTQSFKIQISWLISLMTKMAQEKQITVRTTTLKSYLSQHCNRPRGRERLCRISFLLTRSILWRLLDHRLSSWTRTRVFLWGTTFSVQTRTKLNGIKPDRSFSMSVKESRNQVLIAWMPTNSTLRAQSS